MPAAVEQAHALPDDLSIGQAVEHYLQRYFGAFAGELPPPGLYQRVLAEVEYPLILASMTATRGNQIKAAELLGAQPQHAAQEDPRTRRQRLSWRHEAALIASRELHSRHSWVACRIATMRCIHRNAMI